ncbi:MAG TPA: GAF domain-containing protein [Candidatus Sabulitectum sp.]|nr:GAF domain-containing protein [Candidatus Sabulitectum sp.]HPF31749.1 GAF domain-containing protein [Candidatus Sabulitectum sp.]HPJ28386.1 GAF domain-containing protein [Candidatus Sabulitectum sp.]HPR22157.1 GAF domain-containing protein [Candidatus Sabulitectum sp.]HRW77239.1 GAF domain-containing protein [Candidatus Sabulitectum sp.]
MISLETREFIRRVMDEAVPAGDRLQAVCDLLREAGRGYDWAGFYLVDPAEADQLVLGPFSGEPTEHVRIGFGEGICGQAASTLKVFVVDDVTAESNYLSCSPLVRSEFVAPVIHRGVLVGELDIDSHTAAAFGADDSEFLEWVAQTVSPAVAEAAGIDI